MKKLLMTNLRANPGKKIKISDGKRVYCRYPIRTHIVSSKDNIIDLVVKYSLPSLKNGDALVISERIVAITQGRAKHIKSIKVSFLANSFVSYLYKPLGLGMKSPEKMEMAIREAGLISIFGGVLAATLTKPFGVKGLFYTVAGHGINAIDGPTDYTLPPYNQYVTLGPKTPDRVANRIKKVLFSKGKDVEVVIIDANDLGVRVEGATDKVDRKLVCRIFRDNPMGQSTEQTPLAIVRQ